MSAGALERIEVVEADLTTQSVAAIVNPANAHLAHGGGAAAAISRAAGPELQRASHAIVNDRGPLEVGKAAITDAFGLPCRKVIHVVGPVYGRHGGGEAQLLGAAHRNALRLAAESGLESVALPAISCGIYGYPAEEAAPVAIAAVVEALTGAAAGVELVRFCFIGAAERSAFAAALAELRA